MSNINIPTQVSPFATFSQFPAIGKTRVIYIDQSANVAYYWKVSTSNYIALGAAVAVNWGSITGTLSAQTDLQNALNNKVDKVTGKGLSTNDYTTTEKNKLAGIEAGAQVNVKADWNATTGPSQILNKPTIPSVTGLVPYTGATASVDLGENDLSVRKVFLYDEPNNNFGSIHYTDGNFHIEDADGHKLFVIEDGFLQLHLTDTIQSNLILSLLTVTRDHYLPDASGTLALLSDVATKQDTLVSGTNIKTLNGASLLGSGGLSVQPTLVSGTNIKTINGSSVLGSGDLVVSGGGGGIHAQLNPSSGFVVSNNLTGAGFGSAVQVINRMILSPFIPAKSFTSSNFLIRVFASVALSSAKILIYSDLNGKPNTLLYESTDIDCSTTGTKTVTTSFNFTAGTIYWLGFWGNSTPQVFVIATGNMMVIRNQGAIPNPSNAMLVFIAYGSAPTTLTGTTESLVNMPFIGITQS
jgi:predicted DNA-binding WGR domain protein